MSQRSKIATLYLLAFAVDLANMFIFNAALLTMQLEMQASVTQLAWVGTVYMLGLTVAIPVGSWLAHSFGQRRIFLISLLVVSLAGIGGALAINIEMVLTSRLLQGLGGGLLVPVGQAMAYRAYPREDRAHLTSVVMMVALLVPALSPAISGFAVDHASWRWLFVGVSVIVLGIASLALAWMPGETEEKAQRPFDLVGFLLSTVALFSLPIGLSLFAEGERMLTGALMLGVAVVAAAGYMHFALRSRAPLLDLRLLSNEMLRVGSIIYLCIPGVFTGANIVAALYLQSRIGLTATETGSMMIPWALMSFLAILTTRQVYPVRGPRVLFLTGMVLESAGLLLMAAPVADVSAATLAAFAAMGFGASLCTSAAQTAAFVSVPSARLGEASALWNINRQISFSFGSSVMGSLLGLLMATGLAGSDDAPYRWTFVAAALLTLIPLPLVLRLKAAAVNRAA